MPRKRQHKPRQGLDTEVIREIEKQTQKQQEIDNRRTKQKLIFWSIAIFGTVVITAITGAFLLLLGLVEW
jgi:hypothetical protein